jgi:hypothetical protein
VGLIVFEFARFHAADFARGREFASALDAFCGRLPAGWRYAVELRNRNFLHPDYFALLARHGVTHVFNSWSDMPSVAEQLELPGSFTNPEFFAARFLLKPGRKYEEAVKRFSPYASLQEPYPEGRAAAVKLLQRAARSSGRIRGHIYVGNRFEGNSPESIAAILDEAA